MGAPRKTVVDSKATARKRVVRVALGVEERGLPASTVERGGRNRLNTRGYECWRHTCVRCLGLIGPSSGRSGPPLHGGAPLEGVVTPLDS